MIAAAAEERDAGAFANSLAANQLALAEWLRRRWVEHSGRPGSTVFDAETLLEKLRSGVAIDVWTRDLLRLALRTPPTASRFHAEVVEAIVGAITLEPIKQRGASQ